jgi:hypothetical protein
VKGNTLWGIAQNNIETILGSGTAATNTNIQKAVDKLVDINDITNPHYIVVGQVIKLTGDKTKSSSSSTRAIIKVLGLQSNSDTIYATWTWNQSNTEHYQIKWYYDTGDGVWFVGTDSTTKDKQATYSAPSNAKRVKFTVKPISKKRKVNNKETSYWTASWSTAKIFDFASAPPDAPSGAPTVEIDKYKLTARVEGLENINATSVQFQIVRNDSSVFKTGTATIKTGVASFSCDVTRSCQYKVRCRTVRGKLYSEWTAYSNNVGTIPYAPSKITECRAEKVEADGKFAIYLKWTEVKGAVYEVQYTTNKSYFDNSATADKVTSIKTIIDNDPTNPLSLRTSAEVHGLESGEYYFRVRALNANLKEGSNASEWTPIRFAAAGTDPIAPTTWSSVTTASVGEVVTLYWNHNSEDESKQTSAKILLTVNGVNQTPINISGDTSSYDLLPYNYADGDAKIEWAVQTAGVKEGAYGDVSITRIINVYEAPTLTMSITDVDGLEFDTLTSYPFYIDAFTEPASQIAIGYNVAIIANDSYETVDGVGNVKMVNDGDAVYSKYYDTLNPSEAFNLLLELTPSSIDLENNVTYTIVCTGYLNSGLTATSSLSFTVSWDDEVLEPNAEIGINEDDLSAYIRPYCENVNGHLVEDVVLAVYRREFDGGYTEIAKDIPNNGITFVTDPHPALDYARYRVVATSTLVGSVGYYDIPGIPVNEKSIVIQWDESWKGFDTSDDDQSEGLTWAGSMVKLPYNVDVSDDNDVDVELIEYVGRKHPVSYYGTQLGESATWNVTIDKNDVDTLYALRRLRLYTGDVYVREPSGSGYWANLKVSFSQKHLDVTIPVTINLVRVEGGI